MPELPLTEWINSLPTKALQGYLHRREKAVTAMFLAGEPVNPVAQGRAAAFHEIATLLKQSPEKLREILRGTPQQSETL